MTIITAKPELTPQMDTRNKLLTTNIEHIICGTTPMDLRSEITRPYDYLLEIPGNNQNIRYKFIVAFNEKFFQIEDKKILSKIGDIIGMFHNASLLIDDIEDDSTLRRGKPCAHLKYGIASTINCGNYMYFAALSQAMADLPNLWLQVPSADILRLSEVKEQTIEILVNEMLNLHHGQGLDIYWRDNLLTVLNNGLPSLDDYLQMVMNKTGGLFRLSVRLLGLFASETKSWDSKSLIKLANLLGIIYQVRDDYLNLADSRYLEMKGYAGEDLIEGKLSLPVLQSLINAPCPNSPLHKVLFTLKTPDERRNDPDSIECAIRYLNDGSSLQFTFDTLQSYVFKAKELIQEYPNPSEMLLQVVGGLGDVVGPQQYFIDT